MPSYTSKMPDKNEIVGTWVPDQNTKSLIVNEGRYDPTKEIKLVLQDSGELTMLNIPDWWGDGGRGESNKGFNSYSGTWELSQGKDRVTLNVIYSGTFTELGLLNGLPPYKIELVIGDPDADRAMIFIRQNQEP